MKTELKIALVQADIKWQQPEKNRDNFHRIISDLSDDTELVVLPEMFSTGFTMTPQQVAREEGEKTVAWMQEIAKARNMAITGSISYYDQEEYTNRLFFVDNENAPLHYDKRHAFTLAGEDKVYRPGKSRLLIDYKGFKLCPMICYDLRFPVWARNTEEYDALIYVANWPKPRIDAWDALLKARAIENMAYCLGVNRIGTDINGYEYNGHTSAYDCLGEQLCYSEEAGVVYTVLQRQHLLATREKLNFLADRDNFSLEV